MSYEAASVLESPFAIASFKNVRDSLVSVPIRIFGSVIFSSFRILPSAEKDASAILLMQATKM